MPEFTTLTALADPTRQGILQLLRERPMSVGEVAAQLPISRPAVSQHLAVLKKAGLVREERVGTRHYFSLNAAGFEDIRAFVDSIWQDALNAFGVYVAAQESVKPETRSTTSLPDEKEFAERNQ